MPTKNECQELLNKTDHVWVTNYNGTGVNGMKFTASNGNSIFIPAAGKCYNVHSLSDVGFASHVRSSSLVTSQTQPYCAWDLSLDFEFGTTTYNKNRCDGESVRGVRK